jgi:hypothetical protein
MFWWSLVGRSCHWKWRLRHIFNPLASNIPKWRIFKLQRLLQNVQEIRWDHEGLCLEVMVTTRVSVTVEPITGSTVGSIFNNSYCSKNVTTVAGLSLRRPGFESVSVLVEFVVDQSSTGTGYSRRSLVFPCQCNSTVHLHTRIWPGGWSIGPLVAAFKVGLHYEDPHHVTGVRLPVTKVILFIPQVINELGIMYTGENCWFVYQRSWQS